MLNPQAQEKSAKPTDRGTAFDGRMKLFRTSVIVGLGVFVGAVMGGVCGLFVYANSRTPYVHDGVYAIIQITGIIAGLVLGYLAARNAQAHDEVVEASHKAGSMLLRRYKPKPGMNGQSNVGHRTIGSSNTEEFLRNLLAK
jgi:hypothetical protein